MAEEEQQDFSKLSLEDRAQHKNWKARVSAYDELGKMFQRIDDDKSSDWAKYGAWVRKFPTDSNAAAQEKALEVTLLFLENGGQAQVGRVVPEVMSGIVAKCITATKAKSKELAVDIALMSVELEKYEAVTEELMKGLEQKNPKVVAGCLNIFTEMLRSFGVKVFNLKTVLKKIPVLTEDRDKTVRDETKKLMIEMYRWYGQAVSPQLSACKPLVLQEVETELEKYTEKPHPTRYLRSQQARQERAADEEGGEVDADEEAVEEVAPDIDPYDLLDPVDILSKLPKDFYEKCEAKKWQERKEAMEALESLIVANPKLEAGDYSDLVRSLKRIVGKDSNVVVVAQAGKCIGGLASGLKKKFSPYAPSCISTILEKFKEKKANVVTAMREAVDACFLSTSMEPIQEDIILALQSKNPAVKLETNAFLARAFAKTSFKVMSDKKLMKPYFTAILANLNESDPTVREAAAEALGVAMKHLGDKALVAFTADLEPIKQQKVTEYMEKAVITAPKEKGPKPAPKAEGAKIIGKSENAVKRPIAAVGVKKVTNGTKPEESSGGAAKPTSVPKSGAAATRVAPKIGGTAATRQASSVAVAAKKAGAANKVMEDPVGSNLPTNGLKTQRISDEMKLKILKWNFTSPRDEFIDLLKELMAAAGMGQTLTANMFSPNFKLHLKALDTLQEEFSMGAEGTISNLDLILKWTTLRFFDTNPSVLIRIMDYLSQVFKFLGDVCYNMTDVEANAFVPYLLLKIGDPKDNVRNNVHGILRLLTNVCPPQRIFTAAMEGLKSKNARQRSECLEELSHMIATHGLGVIHPSAPAALKEIAKQISDRDNNVRNSALNAVVQAYYIEGERVYKMIGQLADKDQSLLDERIKRAAKTRPPPPAATIPAPAAARISAPANMPVAARNFSPPPAVVSPVRPQIPVGNATILQPHNLNATVVPAIPNKYRIDFEAIDNMFNDNDHPVSTLELFDTKIEQFEGSEQIALPKLLNVTKGPGTAKMNEFPSVVPSLANQSIDLVVSQISDANIRTAIESCVKLEPMLLDSDTSVIMAGRVDAILSMIALQMRRQQPTLPALNDLKLVELNQFFRLSVAVLTVLFKGDFLSKKASKDCLREIISQLLVLIIDENLDLLKDAPSIIKNINVMVVRIIENAEPVAISSALIRLLNETLCSTQYKQTRLLELVMKCQWKLLKQYGIWVENKSYDWDVRPILMEYHSFIKTHPFNSFQNKDMTPLKTIKTIIHSLVVHVGWEKVEAHLNCMPEVRDSDAGHYLMKIIQREYNKERAQRSAEDCSEA